VDSAPGLSAVDKALYALELPVAGEERVVTWIGNGADVLMERALTWARQERASQRSAQGKPRRSCDIPQEEQLRILRKLFDRFYEETAEEGSSCSRTWPIRWRAAREGHAAGAGDQQTDAVCCAAAGRAGYREIFSVIVGGDDVQNKKPHPEPLLLVAENYP
jgi:phosphoglycolate phosphatase